MRQKNIRKIEEDESRSETTGRRLVYFAAERTLMAWIRAAVGIMALGFVIDRFGIVVRNVLPQVGPKIYPKEFSFWAGAGLVVLGVLMAVVASIRYADFALRYRRGRGTWPGPGLFWGIVFTLAVAAAGAVIFVYLVMFAGVSAGG
jgi:putative membrane protein